MSAAKQTGGTGMSEATLRQVRAADPAGSAWVSANAGSGKTRVLTDRVARLLLAGARPEKILCLTYTRAAAAEMQERLFSLLGGWAMMEDDALRDALQARSEEALDLSDAALARARGEPLDDVVIPRKRPEWAKRARPDASGAEQG